MVDFFQGRRVSTLCNLTRESVSSRSLDPPRKQTAVLVPIRGSEVETREIQHIVATATSLHFIDKVVVCVDRPTEQEKTFCKHGHIKSPKLVFLDASQSEFLVTSVSNADFENPTGKGVAVAAGVWWLASKGFDGALVLHDGDISSACYTEDFVARLAFPVSNPVFGVSASKGFYARWNDKGLRGRLTRNLVTPLLDALPASDFIEFLRELRYPLSGEISIDMALAVQMSFSPNWGFDLHLLHELWKLSPVNISQTELTDNYEHRFEALGQCSKDAFSTSKASGLGRMAENLSEYLILVAFGGSTPPSVEESEALISKFLDRQSWYAKAHKNLAVLNGLHYDETNERNCMLLCLDALSMSLANIKGSSVAKLPSWRDISMEGKSKIRIVEVFQSTEVEGAHSN